MYEVVLRDGQKHEVRITDRPLRVGKRLKVDGAIWELESEESPENIDADSRFILRRAGFVNP